MTLSSVIMLIITDSWDSKAYKYKIVESTPTVEVTELDEYVFIVRTRIGECPGSYKRYCG
jgi:hypothetical protein